MASCGVGANAFIQKYFYDCIYNAWDGLGFALGLASIVCWMTAQLPQMITNIRTQSAEALSPFFLGEWLLGDTSNLIGLLLSGDQLPTQTYTAMYFICADVVLVVQYIYYGSLQRRQEKLQLLRRQSSRVHHHITRRAASRHLPYRPPREAGGAQTSYGDDVEALHSSHNMLADGMEAQPLLPTSPAVRGRALACIAFLVLGHCHLAGRLGLAGQRLLQAEGAVGTVGRRLLGASESLAWLRKRHRPEWARVAGGAMGWVSSGFYLGSRVSQIWKNARRGDTEGLSVVMFTLAIAANVTYGASLLLRTYTWHELTSSLPWLVGSLGTVGMDMTIAWQARHFAAKRRAQAIKQAVSSPALGMLPE